MVRVPTPGRPGSYRTPAGTVARPAAAPPVYRPAPVTSAMVAPQRQLAGRLAVRPPDPPLHNPAPAVSAKMATSSPIAPGPSGSHAPPVYRPGATVTPKLAPNSIAPPSRQQPGANHASHPIV